MSLPQYAEVVESVVLLKYRIVTVWACAVLGLLTGVMACLCLWSPRMSPSVRFSFDIVVAIACLSIASMSVCTGVLAMCAGPEGKVSCRIGVFVTWLWWPVVVITASWPIMYAVTGLLCFVLMIPCIGGILVIAYPTCITAVRELSKCTSNAHIGDWLGIGVFVCMVLYGFGTFPAAIYGARILQESGFRIIMP